MQPTDKFEPVDYLVIGHISVDVTTDGLRLGGTATYSALTALALGLRVGVVTSWADNLSLDPLAGIPVSNFPSDVSTTFENIETPKGRVQVLHHVAPRLEYFQVPEAWRKPLIVHLGPIAQEVEPALARSFPDSMVCLTPQGWLRAWDAEGHVHPTEWPEAAYVLPHATAAVISREDVRGCESCIEEMAASCHILVLTEGRSGSTVFWNGDVRHFPAQHVEEIDPVGAGDIYAASFFSRLYTTRDPWEAARFATLLGTYSVTRRRLDGIPTKEEIESCKVEIY